MPTKSLKRKTSRGQQVCPQFLASGACNKGAKCKLLHLAGGGGDIAATSTTAPDAAGEQQEEAKNTEERHIHIYPGNRRGDNLMEYLIHSITNQMQEVVPLDTDKQKEEFAESILGIIKTLFEHSNQQVSNCLAGLPTITYSAPSKAGSSSSDDDVEEMVSDDRVECLICQAEYEDGEEQLLLPCGHRFHKECVSEWLWSSSLSCPICRHNPTCVDGDEEVEQQQDEDTTATTTAADE